MDPNQVITAASNVAATPVYLDWTFWAFVVAAIAVVLSQLPPLYSVLRRPKLEVEAYRYLALSHTAGNPNVQLYLILTNAGGGEIKIKNMSMEFKRGEKTFTVAAQNYLAQPNDTQVVMFASPKLKQDQEWRHVTNFLNFFSKEEEREYRRLRFDLRKDILAKREVLANKDQIVHADDKYVAPILAFYEKRFFWEAGEYKVKLRVEADPEKVSVDRNFRFTIFESDSQLLRDHTKSYSAGAGILFTAADNELVITPLLEEK